MFQNTSFSFMPEINKFFDRVVKALDKYLPGVDPSIKRSLVAVATLGIFILLLVSLPFALGLIILAFVAYFLWKRFSQ